LKGMMMNLRVRPLDEPARTGPPLPPPRAFATVEAGPQGSARLIWSLTLGGAIWGILLGILLGAASGCVYGALHQDISLGLDGAILGSLILAAGGACYGLALAFKELRALRARDASPSQSDSPAR
jgi:hypothetical protein